MKSNIGYEIVLEKAYKVSAETIFELFADGTVFSLTGANEIQSDFRTDGLFCFTFNDRGTIYGRFVKISVDNIVLDWNVGGFQRPDEINTNLEIVLQNVKNGCVLKLKHKNILFEEAAKAKQKAWNEILDDMESHIAN